MADHFEKVLSIARPIRWEAVDAVLSLVRPVAGIDWSAPGHDDVFAAIRKLKNRKAPGPDGVPAELLKVPGVDAELARILTPHVQKWWHGQL